MIFVIDNDMFYKTYSNENAKYFFDYSTYNLWSIEELSSTEGLVPFISMKEVDVMREFILSLNDARLAKKFTTLSDEELFELFWKYFDDDGVKSSRWSDFDDEYRMKKLVEWCEENGIGYKIEI